MEVTHDAAAGLSEALRETLAPVRSHLETIEREIATLEGQLAELKAVRATARRIVHAADPTDQTAPRAKGQKKSSTGRDISSEAVDAIRHALADHYGPEEDLWAAKLAKDSKFCKAFGGGVSYGADAQKLNKALSVLRDEGYLRLDRVGPTGDGGRSTRAKVYRLTGGSQNGQP